MAGILHLREHSELAGACALPAAPAELYPRKQGGSGSERVRVSAETANSLALARGPQQPSASLPKNAAGCGTDGSVGDCASTCGRTLRL